jgi:RHS repeat-associated protein
VHDQWGNIIAELDATGATVREYIWLVGAEIAPTRGSRTQVDRPIAVVSNVNTAPAQLTVHVDQLNRPVQMTDAAKAVVWSAVYSPFGGAYTFTGSETLNARFPGQWFQLEAGLHYNWHRHYDPSLGRYTQPDPLGFVDGPSVFAYARSLPGSLTDFSGRLTPSQVELPSPPPATDQCVCPFNDGTPSWFLEGGMMRNPCLGGGGGGGAGKGGRGNTTPYGGPSQAMKDKYKNQLEKDGPKSLEKSERRLQERLETHKRDWERYRQEGGKTSSVEREIRNFTNELSVIRSLLGK